ncbi:MAG: hypothetical protein E6G05_08070 [Actinobacteria bacterium]|nr:MAG: hypothetical protein E6G05_08070 [Actinomycetota bacterium]
MACAAMGGDPPPRQTLRVIRAGRTFKVGEPRVIDTSDATVLRRFSRPTRRYCRLADKQVILDIRERQPGFGPRPQAP